MTEFEDAAIEVDQVLGELGLPYAIIGGAAVQRWGEPRFTQDIDLVVMAPLDNVPLTIETLFRLFRPRRDDASEIAQKGRVLVVQASNGYPLDISLGLPGYEEQVIERSVEYHLPSGKLVRLCSPEDLIIHKAVAGRTLDLRDLESVITRQRLALDINYIRGWLRYFSDVMASDEIIDRFERLWKNFENKG